MNGNEMFGIYRALVVNNDDRGSGIKPTLVGRVQVRIWQVHGKEIKNADLPWAEPACLVCGTGDAKPFGVFALPRINSTVWVAFEAGDVSNPIWFGNWMGTPPGVQSPEIGDFNQVDERSGTTYPDIVTIKGYDSKTKMWIRLIKDKRIEVVAEKDKQFIEIDTEQKKIVVKVQDDDWNVEIEATNGDITLTGNKINLYAKEEVNLRIGEVGAWTNNRIELDEGEAHVYSEKKSIFASQGAIHGASPHRSGFYPNG